MQSSRLPTNSRTWFYWFLLILALYSFLWDCLLELDFITHPFEPDLTFGRWTARALTALVIVPAILIIAWLVIRRAPRPQR